MSTLRTECPYCHEMVDYIANLESVICNYCFRSVIIHENMISVEQDGSNDSIQDVANEEIQIEEKILDTSNNMEFNSKIIASQEESFEESLQEVNNIDVVFDDKAVLKNVEDSKDQILNKQREQPKIDILENKNSKSSTVENYIEIAKKALDNGSINEANDSYCRALNLDENNYEAIFGKVITSCRITNVQSFQLLDIVRQIDRAILLAPDEIKDSYRNQAAKELSNFAYNNTENVIRILLSFISEETYYDYINKTKALLLTFDMALYYKPDDIETLNRKMLCLRNYIKKFKNSYDGKSLCLNEKLYNNATRTITEIQLKIKELDIIFRNGNGKNNSSDSGKSGCFIATKVYMNYNSSEVLVLRQYRDHIILNKSLGKVFIRIYYFLGPSIANWIGDNESLMKWVKIILDKIVYKIKTKYNY